MTPASDRLPLQSLDLAGGARRGIRARLETAPGWAFVLYVSLSAFVLYSSMYGFRKPFTASSFPGLTLWGISYKVVLVIAQTLGYMFSKFYGIRFIAGMEPSRRARIIVRLIFLSWLSLLAFALVPAPYNFVFLFVNGLPLGMIWGLVFGFLEGRRVTELMGAILATSFIFASGLAKTVGKYLLLTVHVSEWWMPFVAGSVFVVPVLVATWLLNQTPPPTPEDVASRTIRKPMSRAERKAFLLRFGAALVPGVIAYGLLTILRDFCEDFANELWNETGYGGRAGIFTEVSMIVSLVVLAAIGGFFLIRNNYRAFRLNNWIVIAGFLLAGLSTFAFRSGWISPFSWFLVATSGVYLGYLPYNCFYFERLLATYRVPGNVGFLIYIADAFGYLGTVLVLLVKEFVHIRYSWVDFFSGLFYVAAVSGAVLVTWGYFIYARLYRAGREAEAR